MRKILRAKIHRATVTHADLDYEGSITIPPDLMQRADLCEYESVHVWDVTRGTRLETYAITGEEGSNSICMNGAAAHLVKPGDLVIIASYCFLDADSARDFKPKLIFVGPDNRFVEERTEIAGPTLRC